MSTDNRSLEEVVKTIAKDAALIELDVRELKKEIIEEFREAQRKGKRRND